MAAIKFGVSPQPVYAVYDRRICWQQQILVKTRNSPNSPNIIARQNLLICSIYYICHFGIWFEKWSCWIHVRMAPEPIVSKKMTSVHNGLMHSFWIVCISLMSMYLVTELFYVQEIHTRQIFRAHYNSMDKIESWTIP